MSEEAKRWIGSERARPTKKTMPTSSTPEQNKKLVRRFREEVFNDEDYLTLQETHTSDCVVHGPPGAEDELTGRDAVEGYLRQLHESFPDVEATIQQMVAEDDIVVTRHTYRWTHEGEFMGIPPTGKTGTTQAMAIQRIEAGKIAEMWPQIDTLGLLQQLGAVESLGQ